jgi:hypothetical protein
VTVLLPDAADLAALDVFGRRLDAAQLGKAAARRYYDDPLGFAADCIDWRDASASAVLTAPGSRHWPLSRSCGSP